MPGLAIGMLVFGGGVRVSRGDTDIGYVNIVGTGRGLGDKD